MHLGATGENGPIIATLMNETSRESRLANHKPSGRTAGRSGMPSYVTLLKGVLTSADLEGSLQGQPLDALIYEIQQGNVYVNLHTNAYPDGEIRGHLYAAYNGS